MNKCQETYLRCFILEQPKNWVDWYHRLNYGTIPLSMWLWQKHPLKWYMGAPPPLVRFTQGETNMKAMATELVDRDEALWQLKYHLLRAQQKMKKYADRKHKPVVFELGEWVFVKLRPHRQQTVESTH